jgi:hypothetical protein
LPAVRKESLEEYAKTRLSHVDPRVGIKKPKISAKALATDYTSGKIASTGASRHGTVDPCVTQEGLSELYLGRQTNLKAKA